MKQTMLRKTFVCLVAVLVLMSAGHASAEKTVSKAIPAAADTAPETGASTEDNRTPPAEVDPFTYNVPSDSKGFLPSMTGNVPPGIRVLGIMCLAEQKPLAALSFPGYDEPFYVRENDLIAVNTLDWGKTRAGQRRGGQKNRNDEVVYVQVGQIGRNQVELFPKTNPSNIQILR